MAKYRTFGSWGFKAQRVSTKVGFGSSLKSESVCKTNLCTKSQSKNKSVKETTIMLKLLSSPNDNTDYLREMDHKVLEPNFHNLNVLAGGL